MRRSMIAASVSRTSALHTRGSTVSCRPRFHTRSSSTRAAQDWECRGRTMHARWAACSRRSAPWPRRIRTRPRPCAYTPDALVTVGERNRMIADPYTRLLVARDQVNQAAAVLIASTEAAQELGVDPGKWVYLHGYSRVKERHIMSREDLGASPAARLACREALAAARVSLDDIALFDLYSCFPIAVFNICDGLGLSAQDPRGLTVTGGLPYFGGPGNSYSMHAIASMVEKLRERSGTFGLIGANGGHMSKYAVGIYSTKPTEFVRCDSTALQAQVDSWPAPSVAGEADGPGTIESYTVLHGKGGPSTRGHRRPARRHRRALPGEHARRGRSHAAGDDRGRSARRNASTCARSSTGTGSCSRSRTDGDYSASAAPCRPQRQRTLP